MRNHRIPLFALTLGIAFLPLLWSRLIILLLCALLVWELLATEGSCDRLRRIPIALGQTAVCALGLWLGANPAAIFFAACAFGFTAMWATLGGRLDPGRLALTVPAMALVPAGLAACDLTRWVGGDVLLLFLLALGAQDFVAMAAGRRWPRMRIFAPVSPNKSLIGALLGFAAGLAFWAAGDALLEPSLPLWLAACALVAGQLGDLYYSAVKRGLGVKDFGALLGAKGGLLDRADSSLPALLTVTLLLQSALPAIQ
jgi:phosphatidate cytidylyltransferase